MARLAVAFILLAACVHAQTYFTYPVRLTQCSPDPNQLFNLNVGPGRTLIETAIRPTVCIFASSNTSLVDARDCNAPGSYTGTIWTYDAANGTFTSGSAGEDCLAAAGGELQLLPCLSSPIEQFNFTGGPHSSAGQIRLNSSSCIEVDFGSPKPGPVPPPPTPSSDNNIVIDACPADPSAPLQGQAWTSKPVTGGYVIQTTGPAGDVCLGISGGFPGSHGPNVAAVNCSTTPQLNITWETDIFTKPGVPGTMKLITPQQCLGTYSDAVCDCANGTHQPDGTLPPGSNVELWQCPEAPATEFWTSVNGSQLITVNGLCLTAQFSSA